MLVETFITPRADGTVVAEVGKNTSLSKTYEFKKNSEGRLVCLVDEPAHVGELACINDGKQSAWYAAANAEDEDIFLSNQENYRQKKLTLLAKKREALERAKSLEAMQNPLPESETVFTNSHTEVDPDYNQNLVEHVAVKAKRR